MKNKHSFEKEISTTIEDIQYELQKLQNLKKKDIYQFNKLSTIFLMLKELNKEV